MTLLAATVLGGTVSAQAVTFHFAADGLAAQATFERDVDNNNLIVTLDNSSPGDVMVPSDILTAVFFDLVGTPALEPICGLVAPGSAVVFGPSITNVGGEWAYKAGLTGAPGGAERGISSAGLDLFGPGDLFPGGNLSGPESPDGMQYGLVSAGDDPSTGNAQVTGASPFVKSAVVFTLALPDGFEQIDVSNVWFQYGTDLIEPSYPGEENGSEGDAPIPEPITLICLGSGIGILVEYSRKRFWYLAGLGC
ncbi:MAG: PEP-CTERM sorting domain-containing protein [Planctomycetota bacterium]|nr:PEP-CTERM sorting domain-containing protein [Planctomycetota bacterium]